MARKKRVKITKKVDNSRRSSKTTRKQSINVKQIVNGGFGGGGVRSVPFPVYMNGPGVPQTIFSPPPIPQTLLPRAEPAAPVVSRIPETSRLLNPSIGVQASTDIFYGVDKSLFPQSSKKNSPMLVETPVAPQFEKKSSPMMMDSQQEQQSIFETPQPPETIFPIPQSKPTKKPSPMSEFEKEALQGMMPDSPEAPKIKDTYGSYRDFLSNNKHGKVSEPSTPRTTTNVNAPMENIFEEMRTFVSPLNPDIRMPVVGLLSGDSGFGKPRTIIDISTQTPSTSPAIKSPTSEEKAAIETAPDDVEQQRILQSNFKESIPTIYNPALTQRNLNKVAPKRSHETMNSMDAVSDTSVVPYSSPVPENPKKKQRKELFNEGVVGEKPKKIRLPRPKKSKQPTVVSLEEIASGERITPPRTKL